MGQMMIFLRTWYRKLVYGLWGCKSRCVKMGDVWGISGLGASTVVTVFKTFLWEG